MVYEEKTITSEKIFEGRIIDLRVETVELPNGNKGYRELVDHPGGVGILAVTKEGKMMMVKQFRKPLDKAIWEIPAGKLNKGEDPMECGLRELEEETGYKALNLISLGFFYPSPGFANEITYLFFANDLERGKINPDEDEFLDVEEFSIEDAKKMVLNNEINDAKTLIALLKCEAMGLI